MVHSPTRIYKALICSCILILYYYLLTINLNTTTSYEQVLTLVAIILNIGPFVAIIALDKSPLDGNLSTIAFFAFLVVIELIWLYFILKILNKFLQRSNLP